MFTAHCRCPLVPYTTLFRSFLLEGTWSTSALAGLAALAVLALATVSAVVLSRISFRTAPRTTADNTELADRKSTRLNSSHVAISYSVFYLKKKKIKKRLKTI